MRKICARWLRLLLLILVLALVLLVVFRTKYNHAIRTLACTQVTNVTSDLINDSIDSQINSGDIRYDRIVYFEKDLNGRITALKTNMSEVNRLKTGILNLINDEILALDSSDIGIPIGNLLLPEMFSGRGLMIPVQIISIKNSDASFSSGFSEAGINQTLHQLTMHIIVDISVLVLGKAEVFSVTSQVVVAETIIVGDVPQTYLQSGGLYGNTKENQRTEPNS